MPPPLPPWTEDALILVDPPPLRSIGNGPPIHIYNTISPNVSPFHTPQHYKYKPPPPIPPIMQHRPRITKCQSQDGGLDLQTNGSIQTYDKLSHGAKPRRPRRAHEYEEIHTQYAHLDWQHRH